MKVIIVIRTSNSGSAEQETTWECIKTNEFREDLREKEIKDGKSTVGKLYVFDGMGFYDKEQKDWRYEDIVKNISVIFERNENADFLILFHTTETRKNTLYEKLKEKLPKPNIGKLLIERYSSADTSNSIWNRHLSSFCNDPAGTKDKFIALWNDLWNVDVLKNAQSLRYEILSPLVALDLLKQAEANNTLDEVKNLTELKEKIHAAIKDLNTPVEEFCQGAIECGDFKDQLYQLLAYEDGSSWEKFHKDLKNVAERMETQIAAI